MLLVLPSVPSAISGWLENVTKGKPFCSLFATYPSVAKQVASNKQEGEPLRITSYLRSRNGYTFTYLFVRSNWLLLTCLCYVLYPSLCFLRLQAGKTQHELLRTKRVTTRKQQMCAYLWTELVFCNHKKLVVLCCSTSAIVQSNCLYIERLLFVQNTKCCLRLQDDR